MVAISIQNVTYRYPKGQEPALRDVSLEIKEGEFIGVVGPNGSGKSTLCHLLTGFVPHFHQGEMAGDVWVRGKNTRELGVADLAREVGYIFQDPFEQLSGVALSVHEEVAFGLENLGLGQAEIVQRVDDTLAGLGIQPLRERSPFQLSGGEQQRLAIACALAMNPKILVLDEPTSQLDPLGCGEVFKSLESMRARGMTIVLVEHKIDQLAEQVDRVVVLHRGEIAMHGSPRDVLTDPGLAGLGVGLPQYTILACALARRGCWPGAVLPVTRQETEKELRKICGPY